MNKIYIRRIEIADAKFLFELQKEELSDQPAPELSDLEITDWLSRNLPEIETDGHKIYLIFYKNKDIGYLSITEYKEKKEFSFYNIFVREKFRFLGENLISCFLDFSENRGYQSYIDIPDWWDIKLRKIK